MHSPNVKHGPFLRQPRSCVMSSVAWDRHPFANILGKEKSRHLRRPSSTVHLCVPHPSAMMEQRRPSGQSLVLDLEGLDLGGPAAKARVSNPRASLSDTRKEQKPITQTASSTGGERSSSLPIAQVRARGTSAQVEDSFAAHLREDCVDSQEIFSADTIIKADAARSSSLSQPLTTLPSSLQSEPSITSLVSDAKAQSTSSTRVSSDDVDVSHQVLGGFASLGLSSLPPATFQGSQLVSRESLLQASLDRDQTSWRSLRPQSCDPMETLDILSIEEMGRLAINIGSRDEWDGLILSSGETHSRSSQDDPELSHTTPASWMTARTVQGKRRWICAPTDSKDAAQRTVIVSDRNLDRVYGSSNRPHAAFSGLASFELRFLREDDAADPILLAPARALKPRFTHLVQGAGRRRAESLTRSQLSSPRRNPSERPNSSRGEPVLRRTRSRPAIKVGSLNRPEEAPKHERQLIDSLAEAGLLSGASRPATPCDIRRGSLDERALGTASSSAGQAERSSTAARSHPKFIDLSAASTKGTDQQKEAMHNFPGGARSPFATFNFGEPSVPSAQGTAAEDTSPKSPIRELSPSYVEISVPPMQRASSRPLLAQTLSDQPVSRRFASRHGHETALGVYEMGEGYLQAGPVLVNPPASPSRNRKEGSKLTGWLRKRMGATGPGVSTSSSSSSSTAGGGNSRRGDASARLVKQTNSRGSGSRRPPDAVEYSSDVSHDYKGLSRLVGPSLPHSQSHGAGVGPIEGLPASKWSLQGSLVAQGAVGRRASVSDDQLAVSGQAARKTALGASEARRPSKDATMVAAMASVALQQQLSQTRHAHERRGLVNATAPSKTERPPGVGAPLSKGASGLSRSEDMIRLNKALSRPSSSASSATNDDPLGLDELPSEALVMVLPLPFRRTRDQQQDEGCTPSRYLRVAFVPFASRGAMAASGDDGAEAGGSKSTTSASWSAHPASSGAQGPPLPHTSQWYRRLGRSIAEPSATGNGSHQQQHLSVSSTSFASGYTDAGHLSSANGPEPLLFGAGPARRSEATSTKILNRRTSYVQAFRVTGLVVSASRSGRGPSTASQSQSPLGMSMPLPPAGSFPVVLAVCMEEQSLEFMPEGWGALGLERGPSDDASNDAMFGVADAIIAACAAIMDL